ncbi:hypothetical protein GKQ38_01600 [Candidatus Nanohaloarchaea archaeon]|nr:hypothetical protein GKQ38_01600 [Candidatus Nanohaloarchaea archaeon]
MKQFTCDICGMEFEDENEDDLVQLAKQHMKREHDLQRETDVAEPNIAYEEEEIRERISEK